MYFWNWSANRWTCLCNISLFNDTPLCHTLVLSSKSVGIIKSPDYHHTTDKMVQLPYQLAQFWITINTLISKVSNPYCLRIQQKLIKQYQLINHVILGAQLVHSDKVLRVVSNSIYDPQAIVVDSHPLLKASAISHTFILIYSTNIKDKWKHYFALIKALDWNFVQYTDTRVFDYQGRFLLILSRRCALWGVSWITVKRILLTQVSVNFFLRSRIYCESIDLIPEPLVDFVVPVLFMI